eukprot:m.71245 g.71245  ORF g.71245 m.71245 type:complete len:325 (-) comp20148_c0_seq1:52-1026(-)
MSRRPSFHDRARRRQSRQQQDDVQTKTFTRWANSKLAERDIKITDVLEDFKDGTVLINLIEILSGLPFPRYTKEPQMKIQCISNLNKALEWLNKNTTVKLVNTDANDIYNGNLKIILGLLWNLVYNWDFSPRSAGDPSSKPESSKKQLLKWVAEIGSSVTDDLKIKNFTTDWNDGRVICRLCNSVEPGIIPDESLTDDPLHNCQVGIHTAETKLGVPAVLDPEDMADPSIDELSIITYVSGFRNATLQRHEKKEKEQAKEEEISSKQPQTSVHDVSLSGVDTSVIINATPEPQGSDYSIRVTWKNKREEKAEQFQPIVEMQQES